MPVSISMSTTTMLVLQKHIFISKIDAEGDDGGAETGEKAAEAGEAGEGAGGAPCFSVGEENLFSIMGVMRGEETMKGGRKGVGREQNNRDQRKGKKKDGLWVDVEKAA